MERNVIATSKGSCNSIAAILQLPSFLQPQLSYATLLEKVVLNYISSKLSTAQYCKIQIYRKKPPQRILGDPCRLTQVLMICIWLDFYKDDMLPWVLSSIHIQRGGVSADHFLLHTICTTHFQSKKE
jgi:hypothetical protein